jgi:hypothetical protein
MQRRLKSAVENLTAETIRSRKSADNLGRWLVFMTAALILLTGALVGLTIAGPANGGSGGNPARSAVHPRVSPTPRSLPSVSAR